MSLPIPTDARALTADWLTEALRSAGVLPEGRVVHVERTRFAEQLAVLGQLWRLDLTYEGEPGRAPRQIVAKLPAESATNRQQAVAFRFYQRELNFYRYLPPGADLAVPQFFYGAIDDAGEGFVLLLEDLQPYQLGDQVRGADEQQMFAATDLAARTHAKLWGRIAQTPSQWLADPRSPFHAGVAQHLYEGALPITLRMYSERFTPTLRETAERLALRIHTFWQRMCEPPITLVHGDFRLDNMMFGQRGQRHPVVMMDFQISSFGRGAFDLAYFMSQSVPKELRRRLERTVLERYHGGLLAHGVRDYAFDACVRDYQRALVYCLAYPVIVGAMFDPDSEAARTFGHIFLDRALSAIADTDGPAVLQQLDAH